MCRVCAACLYLPEGREFGVWAVRSQVLHKGDSERSAAEMRRVLTRLGPAFVKIGQVRRRGRSGAPLAVPWEARARDGPPVVVPCRGQRGPA